MKVPQMKWNCDVKLWHSLGWNLNFWLAANYSMLLMYHTDVLHLCITCILQRISHKCRMNRSIITCCFSRLTTQLSPWLLTCNYEGETLNRQNVKKLSEFLNEHLVRWKEYYPVRCYSLVLCILMHFDACHVLV